MALTYNTLQAMINKKYMPVLTNNIFQKSHLFLKRLMDASVDFNERKILEPLEYAKSTNVDFLARYGILPIDPIEIATGAEWYPRMFSGSLTVALEDELENKSSLAIGNILSAKMRNLQRSMEAQLANHIFIRGDSLTATKNWNTLQHLLNATTSVSCGGITPTDATYTDTDGTARNWWIANIINASADLADDSTNPADLVNPSTAVYLKKLLQRGIARCRWQTGENPTDIIVGQWVWDQLELILDPQKTGSKLSEKYADMGFDVMKYRGTLIYADDDLTQNQTSNTDGRMYFINLNYMKMRLNTGAKFKAGRFKGFPNQNAETSIVNAYGNITLRNRRAHTAIYNVYNEKAYSSG